MSAAGHEIGDEGTGRHRADDGVDPDADDGLVERLRAQFGDETVDVVLSAAAPDREALRTLAQYLPPAKHG